MTGDPRTQAYLEEVRSVLTRVTDGSLCGLYATGSIGFGDFRRERSDIDLVGVLRQVLSDRAKVDLEDALAHDSLPCPAHGLDISLVTSDIAESPPRRPPFEFAMSTGHTWRLETSDGIADGEMALNFAICRQSGVTLYGASPEQEFGVVPRDWLLEELAENLHWHQKHIFNPYHDPLGQFSTLNACRAWHFVDRNLFCSKTDGGRWVLSRHPDYSLVATALANRTTDVQETPDRGEVEMFLRHVCEILENGKSTR